MARVETTFETYLRKELAEGKIDFSIRVDENLHFYIYPRDKDGETLDFQVNGNQLICITETS